MFRRIGEESSPEGLALSAGPWALWFLAELPLARRDPLFVFVFVALLFTFTDQRP